MGAKSWMLVYSNANAREALNAGPVLDRDATLKFVAALFPNEKLEQIHDGSLSNTAPPNRELLAGCFPGVTIVAAREFGDDHPSKLAASFIEAGGAGTIHLHAMHSVVDWFAFGVWRDGKLTRSLSLSPDNGVIEDIGARLPFETIFWAGERAVPDEEDSDDQRDYPLPFHPLDLGEAALAEFFGYQLEGDDARATLDPDAIPLMRFERLRPWWKFW